MRSFELFGVPTQRIGEAAEFNAELAMADETRESLALEYHMLDGAEPDGELRRRLVSWVLWVRELRAWYSRLHQSVVAISALEEQRDREEKDKRDAAWTAKRTMRHAYNGTHSMRAQLMAAKGVQH